MTPGRLPGLVSPYHAHVVAGRALGEVVFTSLRANRGLTVAPPRPTEL